MNENLDLVKILKDCPKRTKFYSSYVGRDVFFIGINNNYIECEYPSKIDSPFDCMIDFRKNGSLCKGGECMLFPSKDQRDWSKWHIHFKDGDILTTELGSIFILKEPNKNDFYYSCYIALHDKLRITKSITQLCAKKGCRLATEEEKKLLFDAIKANGYKWNAETKTLEKLIVPKFKVGDIIKDKHGYKVRIAEVNIEDEYYGYVSLVANGVGCISFNEQDNWELIPNKFDPKTLQPFDKVLVRDYSGKTWIAAFFSHISDLTSFFNKFVTVAGRSYKQMIPYNEETKYLLGTNNEAPEFYKCWED